MTEPTARDLEVFAVVVRLDSEKCAAHELGISVSSVAKHCQAVYRAKGVESRGAATLALGWTAIPAEASDQTVAAGS